MSSSDDSTKDRIIPGGRFQLERRSGGLFERGLKDPVLLSPQAKAESLAAIGNIFDAVENEDIEKVRAILAIDQTQADSRDHDRQFFETPLLCAVVTGNLPIIKLLILNGADVNARTFFQNFDESYGWSTYDTPLHI